MGRFRNLLDMVKEGRVGFQIDEEMVGEHEFEPGFGPPGRHPMVFHVTWGPRRILPWLSPFGDDFLKQPLAGTVTISGLCEQAPCEGTLLLRYFSHKKIRYTFDFRGGETDYHYVGEKVHIMPWNLPVSHTTCFGTVVETESRRLVSRSVLHFRLSTMPAFLGSFRLG